MELKLNVDDRGNVSGVVVGSPADGGSGGNGGGATDGAIKWSPENAGPYVNTGKATLGQLYFYEGAGVDGMKAQLSLSVPPNYKCESGATEDLEQGGSMAHSPIVWSTDNPWRIYFKVSEGGPDNVVPVTLNSNYFPQ